jgi:glycerophosphodiester phosphodiesterase
MATAQMVPITVGFNIEMKVPFREEYEDFRLAETDLNAYVDAVLECVYDHAGSRDIIFSSFNPEVRISL